MQWTTPIKLQDYSQAPDEGGVYEIGFWRGNTFRAKYLGKADSSIRDRLSCHFLLKGNRSIREYLIELQIMRKLNQEGKLKKGVRYSKTDLWARWSRVADPAGQEVLFMRSWEYDWNERIER